MRGATAVKGRSMAQTGGRRKGEGELLREGKKGLSKGGKLRQIFKEKRGGIGMGKCLGGTIYWRTRAPRRREPGEGVF